MDDERWSEVKTIVAEALESTAGERSSVVDRLCGSDAELRKAVESLLEVETRANELMDSPAVPEGVRQWETTAPKQAKPRRPEWQLKDWVRSRPTAFWLFLAADFLMLCFYIYSGMLIARYGDQTYNWGFDTTFQAGSWQVVFVDPKGPAAGRLQVGDQVLSLNGVPATATGMVLSRTTGFDAAIRSVLSSAAYEIRVSRNGTIVAATLALRIVHRSKATEDIAAFGTVSLAFFLTAVVLGFLKPDPLVVRRGYLAMLAQALVIAKVLLWPYQAFLRGPAFAVFIALNLVDGVNFALAYLFYCTMFEQVLDVRRWKSFLYLLYPWAALITAGRILSVFGWRIPWLDAHPLLAEFVFRATIVSSISFYVIAPLSICAVITRNYLSVRMPEERRRARWITFGSLAGILPYLLARLVGWFLDPEIERELQRVGVLGGILIPIATGYAIYKHRMFDIRVVVRRGVRYVLAKGVLEAAMALPAIGLIFALTRNAHRTVSDAILNNSWFLVFFALLAGVLRFRVPLTRWLDKRFFRESYGQEQVLLALIDSVQKLDSFSEMAQIVGLKLADVFHPASIAVLLRTSNDRMFSSAYSSVRAAAGLSLSENVLLVTLEAGRRARQVSTIQGVPVQELRHLEALQTDLMVPMSAGGSGLAGVILLGRKLSEEPYTAEDRRLLTALGGQMGMLNENIRLHQMLADQQRSAEELRSSLEANRIDTFRECPVCGRCYDLNIDLCPEDGRALAFSLPISRTVNRYLLERRIGKGGMGIVYEAEDLSLHRRVAVKLMTRGIENPTGHHRAYREARAAARLNHPNIVSTHDFGISGGVAYLVMELVLGEPLRAYIGSGRVIDPAIVAQWFDQILSGVEAAHLAGIIHRDLKPENILISAAPNGGPLVKILDFGIAKVNVPDLPETASVTNPGTVMGSILYMSPEQLTGSRADARSDIFAVGLMAFEVLTGRLPFSGNTYSERVISVLHGNISMQGISGSGKALQSVLRKCLAKDPAARFATAAEVRRSLIPLLAQYKPDDGIEAANLSRR